MKYLLILLIGACTSKPIPEIKLPYVPPAPPIEPKPPAQSIESIVMSNGCKDIVWKDRGKAPIGFFLGMAHAYVQTKCDKDLTARLTKEPHSKEDAYKRYGLTPTLPNIYALMVGLGIRESTGKITCGRDMSANWTQSDTAESGAWQTSLNSHVFSKYLYPFFKNWNKECFKDQFMKGVVVRSSDLKNWGDKPDGLLFQKKSKECGPFQLEYTALLLKETYRHHGPLVRMEAQYYYACRDLFAKIDAVIQCSNAE